jgi:hypothetical protein
MSGVVADHKHIQKAGASPARGQWALVTSEADEAKAAFPFFGFQIIPSPIRHSDDVPVFTGFDVVEGSDIDVARV